MRPKLVVLAVLTLVTVACADAPTGARSDPSGSGIVHPTGWPGSARPIPPVWTPAAERSREATGEPSSPPHGMRTP